MVIAVIMIVYGGIRWMLAPDDSKAAKAIIRNGIGAAIVLAVGVILQTVAGLWLALSSASKLRMHKSKNPSRLAGQFSMYNPADYSDDSVGACCRGADRVLKECWDTHSGNKASALKKSQKSVVLPEYLYEKISWMEPLADTKNLSIINA